MVRRSLRSISRLRAACVVHALVGWAVTPARCARRETVLDCDQCVDAPEEHGVHVQEVHRQDGLGLSGEELAPGRTRSSRRGVDVGIVQDLPHGGGRDAMAESDQFALHPPVSPAGILRCHPHHEILDRCGSGWTSRAPACGVVPCAGDQLAVPSQDRGGGVTGKTSVQRRRGTSRERAASHARSAGV